MFVTVGQHLKVPAQFALVFAVKKGLLRVVVCRLWDSLVRVVAKVCSCRRRFFIYVQNNFILESP